MSETSEGFWREVQRFIQAEIARAHKTQAVAPNVPYGSVVMDQYGHVVHAAAAAGGGGSISHDGFSVWVDSNQTITSGTWTALTFTFEDYDDGYIGVLPSNDIELGSGVWILSFSAWWQSKWTGDAGIQLITGTGGGFSDPFAADYRKVADGTDTSTSPTGLGRFRHTFSQIYLLNFINLRVRVFQNSGSSKDVQFHFAGQRLFDLP